MPLAIAYVVAIVRLRRFTVALRRNVTKLVSIQTYYNYNGISLPPTNSYMIEILSKLLGLQVLLRKQYGFTNIVV